MPSNQNQTAIEAEDFDCGQCGRCADCHDLADCRAHVRALDREDAARWHRSA